MYMTMCMLIKISLEMIFGRNHILEDESDKESLYSNHLNLTLKW